MAIPFTKFKAPPNRLQDVRNRMDRGTPPSAGSTPTAGSSVVGNNQGQEAGVSFGAQSDTVAADEKRNAILEAKQKIAAKEAARQAAIANAAATPTVDPTPTPGEAAAPEVAASGGQVPGFDSTAAPGAADEVLDEGLPGDPIPVDETPPDPGIGDTDGGGGGVDDLPDPDIPPVEMTLDQREDGFIEQLLQESGGGDTSEQEAFLKELFGDKEGQALADQRASMGRAGFGSSGALGAMEGDVRRKNAQALTGETFDLKERTKQNAIDNALSGIGADVDLRRQAADEDLLNNIFSLLGGDKDGEDPAPEGDEAPPIDQLLPDLSSLEDANVSLHDQADVNTTTLHKAPGYVAGDWTLVTYGNGGSVWKNNDTGQTVIGPSDKNPQDNPDEPWRAQEDEVRETGNGGYVL